MTGNRKDFLIGLSVGGIIIGALAAIMLVIFLILL